MIIRELQALTDGQKADLIRLMKELAPEREVSTEMLENVVASANTHLFAALNKEGHYTVNRIDVNWYKNIITQIHEVLPSYKFLVFSDAKEVEIKEVTGLPYVKRAFFGSSVGDLFAISECRALIGSHSTFTDWGGYLGQLPTILPRKPHYGSFLVNKDMECILNEDATVPDGFYTFLKS